MKNGKTYAIVDLETTGTKMDGTNRIIQFSCVFVENHQIVNSFSSLINPLMEVPYEVQQLTGIKQSQLRNAPLFEDIASVIYGLLQDTIFVAHNIKFDYRFLNEELVRVGYPELDLKGIDTVELSQILYPTLSSYRLSDIAEFLKIKHEHPHHADSDAYVTAKLLIKLMKKANSLPHALLTQLVKLSSALTYETGILLEDALIQKHESKLEPKWVQIGNLVLRKVSHGDKQNEINPKFSIEEIGLQKLEKRSEQLKLMHDVQHSLQDGLQTKTFFEAPTGSGKTLGYLIPCSLETQFGHQFLITTATNALQNQLVENELKKLQEVLPFSISVISLKGSQHYIDLDKFAHTLERSQNNFTKLIQMRILVWLSETQTGDLDELQFTVQNLPLFDEIIHHGISGLNQDSNYYEYDFVKRHQKEILEADFVVTNHMYLLHHIDEFKETKRTLIVDEAQQLISAVLTNNNETLDFDKIKILSDTLLVKMESQISYSFKNLVEQKLITKGLYHQLLQKIQVIDHQVPLLRTELFNQFIKKQDQLGIVEVPMKIPRLFGFVKNFYNLWNKINNATEYLKNKNTKIYQQFIKHLDDGCLDSHSFNLFKSYFKLSNDLLNELEQWHYLSLEYLEKNYDDLLVWLSFPQQQENAHLRMHFGLLEAQNYLLQNIYPVFDKIMFFSGSNFTSKTFTYFCKQLGINQNTRYFKYASEFNFAENSQMVVIDNGPDVSKIMNDQYVDYLVEMIQKIGNAQTKQTLILFSSNEVLEKTYEALQETSLPNKWEILAQGVTGGAGKLKKKFSSKTVLPQMLLATGTFWEGIDLPKEELQTLVITKLPFQAFQSSYNQIRYRKDEQMGGNAFNDIALPEAIMQFSQGIGRLIRTKQDYGIAIVLDSRIARRTYGKDFITSIPDKMPVKNIKAKDLFDTVQKFFTKDLDENG